MSDEDAEEDTEQASALPPATPTLAKGAKKVPPVPVLSGARANPRANKKRAGGTTTAPKKTPQTNGTTTSVPKIKVEEDILDTESVAESTSSGPEEPAPTLSIDVGILSSSLVYMTDTSSTVAAKGESSGRGAPTRIHTIYGGSK